MRTGAGCVGVFALPFAGTGVLVAGLAVREALAGVALDRVALMAFAALAFGGAGFGLMALAWHGRRRLLETSRLRAAHPEQPWMWKPDWASGRIRSSDGTSTVGGWTIAIMWNAVSAPVLFFLPGELGRGNYLALIGLLFPLLGAGMIVWAIRATARLRRFGASYLELDAMPVPPGGALRGWIRVRLDTPPDQMRVVLTCVRRIDRGGDDGVSETILWQDERIVADDAMRPEHGGVESPVAFDIPADATQSDPEMTHSSVHWRLDATAAVTGVDYRGQFEIPIFRVPDGAQAEQRRGSSASRSIRPLTGDAAATVFDPVDATVQVGPSPEGGTEYRFGPARNPGAAFGLTVVFLIFGGTAVGIRFLGAPLLMTIFFGFFGALLLSFTIDLWLGTTTVSVVHGSVIVRYSVLGIGRSTRYRRDEIRGVAVSIGMSQQETPAQSARGWYDIKLVRVFGTPVSAGTNVRSRREAEWLAAGMAAELGLDVKRDAA